jgi:hypothetical protein
MNNHHTRKITLPGGKVIEIVYFAEEGAGSTPAAAGAPEPGAAVPADLTDAVVGLAPATDGEGAVEAALDAAEAAVAAVDRVESATPALCECPSCASELVYPVAWEERSSESWRIERRCPNCEWTHEGDFEQPEVEAFDDVLNEGTEAVLDELRRLSRENMAEDVERLIALINADVILPMDF